MAKLDYSQFTKAQKLAAFFIFIGPDSAAKVMNQFETSQLELICREMATLEVIDESVQRQLLREFGGLVLNGSNLLFGGVSYAQAVLIKAKGDYAASSFLSRVAPMAAPSEACEDIRHMDVREILNLVRTEQPQTIAFILSYLDVPNAAEVVEQLPEGIRDEVVERLGSMEATSTEVVQKIVDNLSRNPDRKPRQQSLRFNDGVKVAADVLNALSRETRKTILSAIEERDAELGAAIRKKIFRFEDLARLERGDLQRIMREIDSRDLALALKLADSVLMTAILVAVSKRAAEDLKDDIEMLGTVRTKDIQAAQDRIIDVVRRLEDAEEISLDAGGDDRDVV